MRQLRLLGVAIVAIVSLGVAASAAQAVEPEFRALPEGLKFTFKSKAGEPTVLVTLAGKEIKCESVEGKGAFESPAGENRLGKVEFKFKGCKGPLASTCTGLGDSAGEILFTAEFHIRHLLKSPEGAEPQKQFNIVVLLTNVVHFSCSIILITVLGCVASMDVLTKENGEAAIHKLLESAFVNFLQKNGDQEPTSIDTDNSLGMESCILKSKEGSAEEETAGQLGSGFMEKFENAKGEKITGLVDLLGIY